MLVKIMTMYCTYTTRNNANPTGFSVSGEDFLLSMPWLYPAEPAKEPSEIEGGKELYSA
jgi:hypothetical protein